MSLDLFVVVQHEKKISRLFSAAGLLLVLCVWEGEGETTTRIGRCEGYKLTQVAELKYSFDDENIR